MMHDYGWHWGFGFGHWALGLAFWVVVILLVSAAAKYLFMNRK
jgi:hypothetical protein